MTTVTTFTFAELCRTHGLNSQLAQSQGLDIEDVIELIKLHHQREELFTKAEALDPNTSDGLRNLFWLVGELETLEFSLQGAWRFPMGKEFHTWWNLIPHCKCSTNDNRNTFGVDVRYISPSCKLHFGRRSSVTIDANLQHTTIG